MGQGIFGYLALFFSGMTRTSERSQEYENLANEVATNRKANAVA
jgi:hypothetical protein